MHTKTFSFLTIWTVSCFLVSVTAATARSHPPETPAMKQARKEAAHRKRRIILNNDGNDARGIREGEKKTPEAFLARRSTPLVGSQVDAIFYCTGVFNLYTHKSTETELRGRDDHEHVDWAWELTKQGTDSLTVMTDFGHQHGMEVFWSMRMNDTHDSADKTRLCKWKRTHPQCLMGKKEDKFPYGGHRWSAVNYANPIVRKKVFRILQDVATRYDIDGIELDFFRHPVFFKPQLLGEPVTPQQCDLMTDLLRRIRTMTLKVAAKRGRPMLVAVRIPDSLGFARGIGLDIEQWLREDLVDIITGTCYFQFEPWDHFVALGKKYDVPAYACLSGSRIVSAKNPENNDEKTKARWYGEAALAWRAGVDGLYTFNLFNPNDPLFRTLGSPDTLIRLEAEPLPITGNPKSMDGWLKGGSAFITFSPPINARRP